MHHGNAVGSGPEAMIDERLTRPPRWRGEAMAIVANLREEILSFRAWVSEHLDLREQEGDRVSPQTRSVMVVLGSNLDAVAGLVGQLDRLLEQSGFHDGESSPTRGQELTLGSYDLHFELRKIRNGFLDPVLRKPVVENISNRVIAFLLSIEGEHDLLIGESGGGVGWHYHYVSKNKVRSDTVLAWDVRADVDNQCRAIFSEKHAARGKSFFARPAGWKDEKRKSIREACRPDLDRWDKSAFRNASNDAQPVWPRDAVLTPRPAVPPNMKAMPRPKPANKRHG